MEPFLWILFFFFFFLASLGTFWDLISPTRDGARAHSSASTKS